MNPFSPVVTPDAARNGSKGPAPVRRAGWYAALLLAPVLALVPVLAATLLPASPAHAQSVMIPNLWDPNQRFVRPDLDQLPRLRFLTTTDFPPFNFIDRRRRLTGFHIDLARAICQELEIMPRCQIQALPWDEIDKALAEGEGEAMIAGMAITAQSRDKYAFSRPYLQIPGRFVTRRDSDLQEPLYEALFRKPVGVVAGSAHEAYFSEAFEGREALVFPTRQLAFNSLMNGDVEAVFTDALSAGFWIASAAAADCCRFAGGPYLSEEHFGIGLAIAVPKENQELVQAFDYALKAINDNGTFQELYLKYFPLGLY